MLQSFPQDISLSQTHLQQQGLRVVDLTDYKDDLHYIWAVTRSDIQTRQDGRNKQYFCLV